MSQNCKLRPILGFCFRSGCYGFFSSGKAAKIESFVVEVDLRSPPPIRAFINAYVTRCVVFVGSLVSGLLRSGRPFYVRRLIVPAVVDSVESVDGSRFEANIKKEIRKAIYPSSANFYSAAAVVNIGLAALVKATLFHVSPSIVFWRSVHSVFFIQHGFTVSQ